MSEQEKNVKTSDLTIADIRKMGTLKRQDYFINEVINQAQNVKVVLSEEQRNCGLDALIEIERLTNKLGKNIVDYKASNIYSILRPIMSNKFRNVGSKKHYAIITRGDELELTLYKEAYEYLMKKYGNGLDRVKPIATQYVVYEGEEFTDMVYNGLEVIQPIYRPNLVARAENNYKIKHLVYALRYSNGEIQWMIVSRGQAKNRLIAQAKNNGAPEEFINKISAVDIDTIFEKYVNDFEMKDYKGKKYKKYYLNETWRNPAYRESMLLSKMASIIAQSVGLTFEDEFTARAYEETYDYDYSKDKDKEKNFIENANEIIEHNFETENRMVEDLEVVEEIEELNDVEYFVKKYDDEIGTETELEENGDFKGFESGDDTSKVNDKTGEIVEKNANKDDVKDKSSSPQQTIIDFGSF